MYKKCVRCYEDNKKPNNEDCNECDEQLKRLEKENKMLQELKDEDSLRVVQLAKENEELRIQNSNFDNQVYRANEMLSNCNSKLQNYKQALEEIREIINNHIKCFYGNCKDCLYYQECDMQNIECDCSKYHINKINEVLNEE